MTQAGSASRSASRTRGMAMPASAAGRRPPERSHHPQPVVGILPAPVALHHHPIPGAKGDEVGAVLEAPGGLGRLGDRPPKHPLDQGALRLLGRHGAHSSSALRRIYARP